MGEAAGGWYDRLMVKTRRITNRPQVGLIYRVTPAGKSWMSQVLGKLTLKHPELIATGLTVARPMAARDNIILSVSDDSVTYL